MARKDNQSQRNSSEHKMVRLTPQSDAGGRDLKDIITGISDERAVRRHITKLALPLYKSLRISDGADLVFILGDGTERDNLAAVETWVSRNLPSYASFSPADQFASLRCKFLGQLNDSLCSYN